jgi:hypothetical protein
MVWDEMGGDGMGEEMGRGCAPAVSPLFGLGSAEDKGQGQGGAPAEGLAVGTTQPMVRVGSVVDKVVAVRLSYGGDPSPPRIDGDDDGLAAVPVG